MNTDATMKQRTVKLLRLFNAITYPKYGIPVAEKTTDFQEEND